MGRRGERVRLDCKGDGGFGGIFSVQVDCDRKNERVFFFARCVQRNGAESALELRRISFAQCAFKETPKRKERIIRDRAFVEYAEDAFLFAQ